MMKKILRKINSVIKYDATVWNIGFSYCTPDQLIETGQLGDVRWVRHNYKESWFADPFILNVTENEYDILVEQMDIKINKGKISRMVVNKKNMEVISLTTLLELPTHLSFPHIILKDDKVYFYPDNSESQILDLYLFSPTDNKVEKVNNLISGEKIVDAQMLEVEGRSYIFGTIKPNQSKDTVTIFEAEKWDGNYQKIGTFKVGATSARGAGEIFEYRNKLIRPSQDSAKGYGNGVVLSEIMYHDGQFSNCEIRRIYPDKKFCYRNGLHTINFYANQVLVIDGYNFNKPFFALTINTIRRLFK